MTLYDVILCKTTSTYQRKRFVDLFLDCFNICNYSWDWNKKAGLTVTIPHEEIDKT